MKAPVIFAIVVRVVGLVFIYQTVQTIIGLINFITGQYPQGTRLLIPYGSVLNLILLAGAAIWFLRGAPLIQNLAYPKRDEESSRRGSDTDLIA